MAEQHSGSGLKRERKKQKVLQVWIGPVRSGPSHPQGKQTAAVKPSYFQVFSQTEAVLTWQQKHEVSEYFFFFV